MQNVINNILFGKYQIISILGTGSFGTVYLSRHLILECYRAIKFIPKTNSRTDSQLKEAKLLKSLHHPGIPILYDIEEDDNFYYLIEEYVEGESLESFLLHQTIISQSTFLDLSLQLCNIFQYLHTLKPSPILYLDLKPEHIIVCGMQIKLIDFNVATFLSNLGNIYTLFGNEDFSAPEISSGKLPNLPADIYSIGKIMQYLSNHLDDSLSPNFHKIIHKATAVEPACRFETVDQLVSALENEKKLLNQPHLRKNIAIIGSHSGCGSTHFAISLVSTLNYMGYNSIYYEQNQGNSLRQMISFVPFMKETNGMICYRYFKGYPLYGPGVTLPDSENADIFVYDYGNTFPTSDMAFDYVFYVCSNAVWHWNDIFKKGSILQNTYSHLTIICNMGQKTTMHHFSKQFSLSVYHYPYDIYPFSISHAKVSLFLKLLQIKRRHSLFFHLRNVFIKRK